MQKIEWIGFGYDLDSIWIEIGVFKNFKECAHSPCNGNHFSSSTRAINQGEILTGHNGRA